MGSRNGGMRKLSMKKLGMPPIGALSDSGSAGVSAEGFGARWPERVRAFAPSLPARASSRAARRRALALSLRFELAGELPCACWLCTWGVLVAGALLPVVPVPVVPVGPVVVGDGVLVASGPVLPAGGPIGTVVLCSEPPIATGALCLAALGAEPPNSIAKIAHSASAAASARRRGGLERAWWSLRIPQFPSR